MQNHDVGNGIETAIPSAVVDQDYLKLVIIEPLLKKALQTRVDVLLNLIYRHYDT
jgi:hypothetical protein